MISQLTRSVAMYRVTTNMPKKSNAVPRSFSKTSTIRLSAQTATTGPRSRPRGKSMPRNRRLASESTSRLRTR